MAQLLNQSAYVVDHAKSGEKAGLLLDPQSYDLILLDLNLPGIKGQNLLMPIRSKKLDMPVLIISAQNESKTIVENLDLGADDYLTKPFQIDEREARMRTLIRRANGKKSPIIKCGSRVRDTNGKIFIGLTQNRPSGVALPCRTSVLSAASRLAGTILRKS